MGPLGHTGIVLLPAKVDARALVVEGLRLHGLLMVDPQSKVELEDAHRGGHRIYSEEAEVAQDDRLAAEVLFMKAFGGSMVTTARC